MSCWPCGTGICSGRRGGFSCVSTRGFDRFVCKSTAVVQHEMQSHTAPNIPTFRAFIAQAKKLGINISAVLEHSLADKVKMLKAEAWKRENKEAIEEYNEHVQTHDSFGDQARLF